MRKNKSIYILAIISCILLISCIETPGPQDCVPIFFEDFETGDFNNNDWVLEGHEDPIVQNQEVYKGDYSAEMGNITQFQHSSFEVTLNLSEKSYVTFFRKVNCDPVKDTLEFLVDDQSVGDWSYKSDWEKVTRFITQEGTHTLKWKYSRRSQENDYQNSV
jgi:hypothetical protein